MWNRAANDQVVKVLQTLSAAVSCNRPFKLIIGTDFGSYAAYAPQAVTAPDGRQFVIAAAIVREAGKPYAKYDRFTEDSLTQIAASQRRRLREAAGGSRRLSC